MPAAVTGASGCIGRALLRQLAGNAPSALFRRWDDVSAAFRDAGGQPIVGDLDDEHALGRLVEGADVVYHCAAAMGKNDPETSWRVNVTGTERLARIASQAGIRRFVYVSSIAVFSGTRTPDDTFTEETQPQDIDSLNQYAATKYRGEERVREVCARSGVAFTIIRPTNVYGPWSRPWFLQLVGAVRWLPAAVGQMPVDVVYVDDVARALVQAARSMSAADQVFHIGHEPLLFSEFLARVGQIAHRRLRPLPPLADRWVRVLADRGYRFATGKRMSWSLIHPAAYPHDRAARLFGYEPQVKLDEGLALTAAWYHQWR